MKNFTFKIQGQTELHKGSADIIDSNSYADLVKEAESAFDGDCTIRKIGSFETTEHAQVGYSDTYDVYECYQDSGSNDYLYYAIAVSSTEL